MFQKHFRERKRKVKGQEKKKRTKTKEVEFVFVSFFGGIFRTFLINFGKLVFEYNL